MRRITANIEPGLRKYVIGLGVLGVLTLGLAIVVIVQGSAAKSDKQTYSTAKAVAADLEDYIDDKNTIPSNLKSTTHMTIPDRITYSKVSSTEYKFCVNYKSASSDFNASSAQSTLLGGLHGSSSSSTSSSRTKSYLNVSSSHNKGKNCQTVKPTLHSYYDSSSSRCRSAYTSNRDYSQYYSCLYKSYDNSSSI